MTGVGSTSRPPSAAIQPRFTSAARARALRLPATRRRRCPSTAIATSQPGLRSTTRLSTSHTIGAIQRALEVEHHAVDL